MNITIITNFINAFKSLIDSKVSTHNENNSAHSSLFNSKASSTHDHGNLKNDGKVGTTDNASMNVVTNASGYITTEAKPTIPSASSTATDIKMNGTQSAGSSSKFAKADHVHPTDTSRASTSVATTNANGLMSSSDKTKLDGIATGANAYSHPSSHATTMISNDQKYNNIKSGESTTLTLTNQKLINDAINTKIGTLPTTDTVYTHPSSHPASMITGLATVATSGKASDLNNDSGFLTSHNPIDSSLSSSSENAVQNKVINTALGNKVDKVSGKGLSTNDFNATYKGYVDNLVSSSNTTKNAHVHGSIGNGGTLNSDITSVNKIAVTDSSNNLKTISQIPYSKVSGTPTIVNNLTSGGTTSVLSAEQGKTLKGSLDTLSSTVSNKVDKVSGKGLSTNDFTTTYKDALDNLSSTIATAVGNLELVEVVSSLPTTNIKTNKLYLVANTVNGTNNKYDIYLRVGSNWEKIDSLDFAISDYIKKSTTSGLIKNDGSIDTNTYVTTGDSRLTNQRTPSDGSVTNAKVASNAAIAFSKLNISKDNITGLGIPASDTVYTHPNDLNTTKTSGLYKIALNGKGHVTSATAVAKEDITALGIPSSDTVYTHPTELSSALTTKSLYQIKANTKGHITEATSIGIDSTSGGTSNSSNLITSGAVYSGLNGKVDTSDNRLTNARTPTAHSHTTSEISDFPSTMTPSSHTHTKSEISDFPTSMTPTSHAHGNLQNGGTVSVSGTVQKSKNLVTDANGYITAEAKPTIPSASSTTPSADTTNGSVGSGTTWAKADHRHPKSSLYAEASHAHDSRYYTQSEIDTKLSEKASSDHNHVSGWTTVTCSPGTLYVNPDLKLCQWIGSGTVSISSANTLTSLSTWNIGSSTYYPSSAVRIKASTTENLFAVIDSTGSIGFTCDKTGNGKSYNGIAMWKY